MSITCCKRNRAYQCIQNQIDHSVLWQKERKNVFFPDKIRIRKQISHPNEKILRVWTIGFSFPSHLIDTEQFCFESNSVICISIVLRWRSDKRRSPIRCQWKHISMLKFGWNFLLYRYCSIFWNVQWMTFLWCILSKAEQDSKFWKKITWTIFKIECQITDFCQFATN